MIIARSPARGRHAVAASALAAGATVVRPSCVVSAMSSLQHCDGCKRRLACGGQDDDDALCLACGSFALCESCREEEAEAEAGNEAGNEDGVGGGGCSLAEHQVECRAYNELAMHLEANEEEAVLATSPQLLRLLVRFALRGFGRGGGGGGEGGGGDRGRGGRAKGETVKEKEGREGGEVPGRTDDGKEGDRDIFPGDAWHCTSF